MKIKNKKFFNLKLIKKTISLILIINLLFINFFNTPKIVLAALFKDVANYSTDSGPYDVTSSDFNNDGYDDLAVSNSNGDNISVLLNNGNGTFASPTNYSVEGDDPRRIVSADFDNDNDYDIAVTVRGYNDNDLIAVFFNNGSGSFSGPYSYPVGDNPWSSLIVDDFNNDGYKDLAATNEMSGNVSVLVDNGSGSFTVTNYSTGTYPESVIAQDFNSDGYKDLAVANAGSNNVSVLLNNGNGTFGSTVNYGTGISGNNVIAAYLNNDSYYDLVVVGSNKASVLLNNGNGTFGSASNYDVGSNPMSVVAYDFNKDNYLDLAVANWNSGNVSVLLNNGNGTFGSASNYETGQSAYMVYGRDFDKDGNTDLLVTNHASSYISVLTGKGDGTFNSSQNFSTGGSGSKFAAIKDFDKNNYLDFAVILYEINSVGVFLNDNQDPPGITVNPTSGLTTTEAGGTAQFTVVLNTQPTANVTIGLSSSDTTEGTVSPSSLTFTPSNWNTPQTVTITGVDDDIDDGNIAYTIVTAAASSSDENYNGLNASDVSVTNIDDDDPSSNNSSNDSNQSSSSSSSSSSSPSAPACSKQAPNKAPWIYGAIPESSTSIRLYFTPSDEPVSRYVLVFGTKSGNYQYGLIDMGINERNQMTFLVDYLSPNTTYYFKIQAANDCAPGPWSNEISAKTKGLISFNQLDVIDFEMKTSNNSLKKDKSCQEYKVKPNETLWSIAKKLLGDGTRYKEIIEENKESYPSLKTSNSVRPGWILKINCSDKKITINKPENRNLRNLRIKVLDEKNNPIKDAKITILSKIKKMVIKIETTTDKDGVAEFENIYPLEYKVLVNYKEFKTEQVINLNKEIQDIDFEQKIYIKFKKTSLSLPFKKIALLYLNRLFNK